ncbi:hypothetical protein LJC57_10565 [Parabacteroides sp. OttesenSCG-928-G07]|nr:hypothetical protein [Parabacteroides sp. OttesenSCG-928-G21]MDL2279015.1 hypothetical protein [Parabacteroides sp. OttesenSCG-928-G07]
MKTRLFILSLTMLFFLTSTSCSLIDDLIHKDISIDEFALEIPVTLDQLKSDDNWRTFTGAYENLNIDHPRLKALKEYKDYKFDLIVEKVTVEMANPEIVDSGLGIKDFICTASTINKDYSTPNGRIIDITERFSDRELANFVQNVLRGVQDRKTIDLSVTGKTDVKFKQGENRNTMKIKLSMKVKARVYLSTLFSAL